MEEIALGAKALALAKKVISSKWLYVGLAFIALAGGTYFYLVHDKKEAVTTAVKGADQAATNKTLQTGIAVDAAVAAKEPKFIILHDQTVKDYTNARATLQAAPADERSAQAPRLIIDTINDLDRMRAARDSTPVSDAEVPVG